MSPSASELAKAAADMVTALLDKTCSIARPTGAQDAFGHASATTTAIASGVKCGLERPSRGLLLEKAAQIRELSTWDLALPNGTNILAGDMVTIGADTYTVQSTFDGETWQLLLHVLIAEAK